jgi:hypothetical protein
MKGKFFGDLVNVERTVKSGKHDQVSTRSCHTAQENIFMFETLQLEEPEKYGIIKPIKPLTITALSMF